MLEVTIRGSDERLDDVGASLDGDVDVTLERSGEGDDLRIGRPGQLRYAPSIFLPGHREPRLDERHSEVVEPSGTVEFLFDGDVPTRHLGALAKRDVCETHRYTIPSSRRSTSSASVRPSSSM